MDGWLDKLLPYFASGGALATLIGALSSKINKSDEQRAKHLDDSVDLLKKSHDQTILVLKGHEKSLDAIKGEIITGNIKLEHIQHDQVSIAKFHLNYAKSTNKRIDNLESKVTEVDKDTFKIGKK